MDRSFVCSAFGEKYAFFRTNTSSKKFTLTNEIDIKCITWGVTT